MNKLVGPLPTVFIRLLVLVSAASLQACAGLPAESPSHSGMSPSVSDMGSNSTESWHIKSVLHIPQPTAIAVDSNENIYFTQYKANNAKVLHKDGAVASLGGDLKSSLGIAVHETVVYVADAGNNELKKINRRRKVEVIGTGWGQPLYVATDPQGNVFVFDSQKNAVFEVMKNGDKEQVVPPTICSGILSGLTVDGADNVYVSCLAQNEIFEVSPSGNVEVLCSLNGPTSLADAAAGQVYAVGEDQGEAIFLCNSSGATKLRLDRNLGQISDIAFFKNDVYVSSFGLYEILKLSPPK